MGKNCNEKNLKGKVLIKKLKKKILASKIKNSKNERNGKKF